MFYRRLFPTIIMDIRCTENNWRSGKHTLNRINCRSEGSKGVYCLQYDDQKIISGLRDNTIKIWDRKDLACSNVSEVKKIVFDSYDTVFFKGSNRTYWIGSLSTI